ncbi:MAG: hypothetical protein ACTSRP_07250 [Candidatus Helarchaeota archaeon]
MNIIQYTYGDIPDNIYLKPFLPLLSFLWRVFKKLGWDGVDNYDRMGNESIFKFFETRLNESIFTVRDVIDGKIKNPDKVMSYIIMLPSLVIRSDLVIGTQKLFGGDSVDISFAVLHDYHQEILLILNCHCEDGVPVDWYMIQEDDELLNRRHMRLGYKLREIPRRVKNNIKSAKLLVDVLKDIRNERTPQWSLSDYYVGTVISSWAINLMCQPSNYESIAETYDGRAAKELYGLPDYTFGLEPFPSAFNMFFMKGRPEFCKILASITTNMHFYIQPFEPFNYNLIKTRTPEFFEIYKEKVENEGVPFPIQTIKSSYPNIKKKDPNLRFEKKYPPGIFLRPSDIGMDLEEFLHGVYLDVTHETTPDKIDESSIISTGIGRSTKFK